MIFVGLPIASTFLMPSPPPSPVAVVGEGRPPTPSLLRNAAWLVPDRGHPHQHIFPQPKILRPLREPHFAPVHRPQQRARLRHRRRLCRTFRSIRKRLDQRHGFFLHARQHPHEMSRPRENKQHHWNHA